MSSEPRIPAWARHYRDRRAAGAVGWSSDDSYARKRRQIDSALRDRSIASGATFLDIGCGAGNVAVAMAERGWCVTGIDLVPEAIAWARDRSEALAVPQRPQFLVADLSDLRDALADNTFDVAFDSDCFHMILAPAHRRRAFAEVHRIVRRGGLFLTSTQVPNPSFVGQPKDGNGFDSVTRFVHLDGRAEYYLATEDELLAALTSAGFHIVNVERHPPITRALFAGGWIAVTMEKV